MFAILAKPLPTAPSTISSDDLFVVSLFSLLGLTLSVAVVISSASPETLAMMFSVIG
jgi:hypothetical protein